MRDIIDIIVTILVSLIASSGLWTFLLSRVIQKDAKNDMLKGLGHDRIIFLGNQYIERGYITTEEYENLHDFLYVPYEKLNGNGSAKKIMAEVEKLPIKNEKA